MGTKGGTSQFWQTLAEDRAGIVAQLNEPGARETFQRTPQRVPTTTGRPHSSPHGSPAHSSPHGSPTTRGSSPQRSPINAGSPFQKAPSVRTRGSVDRR